MRSIIIKLRIINTHILYLLMVDTLGNLEKHILDNCYHFSFHMRSNMFLVLSEVILLYF